MSTRLIAVEFRRAIIASLCATLSLTLIVQSAPPAGYNPTPVFEDNFNSLDLDVAHDGSKTWADNVWNVRKISDDRQWWVHENFIGNGTAPLNIKVHEITSSGTLILNAYPTPCDKLANVDYNSFVASMLSTSYSKSWYQGYFEFRVKVPLQQGMHFGVWLAPASGAWFEIDMLELCGQAGSDLGNKEMRNAITASGKPSGGDPSDGGYWEKHDGEIAGVSIAPENWHTYGFLWDSDSLKWFFDGVEWTSCASRVNGVSGYPSSAFLLIMTEIASSWPRGPNAETTYPMQFEIDYIRIYQKQ
jgi:beta-glucanase (GH16 family)